MNANIIDPSYVNIINFFERNINEEPKYSQIKLRGYCFQK